MYRCMFVVVLANVSTMTSFICLAAGGALGTRGSRGDGKRRDEGSPHFAPHWKDYQEHDQSL